MHQAEPYPPELAGFFKNIGKAVKKAFTPPKSPDNILNKIGSGIQKAFTPPKGGIFNAIGGAVKKAFTPNKKILGKNAADKLKAAMKNLGKGKLLDYLKYGPIGVADKKLRPAIDMINQVALMVADAAVPGMGTAIGTAFDMAYGLATQRGADEYTAIEEGFNAAQETAGAYQTEGYVYEQKPTNNILPIVGAIGVAYLLAKKAKK